MCELFGVSSAKRMTVNPYLKTLMSHSVDHPHGWGIAVFYGNAVSLEKEPKPAWVSDYLQSRLRYPMEVQNMIAHIRFATRGSMDYENCHPFVDRDAAGRAWTLAHNGTIFQSEILDAYRDIQAGATDSERILCHIIRRVNEKMSASQCSLTAQQRFRLMDEIILEIAEHNKLNLLVYDGELLYVHTNLRHTLYRTKREDTVLFATVPLDESPWEPVPMMQLLGFRDGQLAFEGSRHTFEYVKPDSSVDDNICSGI